MKSADGATRGGRISRNPPFTKACYNPTLEQFTGRCSDLAASEFKRGKEAETGDAVASSMQADAATRRRSKANRYRFALSALASLLLK